MKILVTGPTGTAGSEVVNQALLDPEITAVTALSRKPLSVEHSKLKVVLHQDFSNYSDLADILKEQDGCIWCLGISQTQVSKEQYEVITYDYTMAAGKAFLQANPNAIFVFLSVGGADSTEQSRTTFARVKGKTENALKKIGFQRLWIVRPGGIKPAQLNPNTSLANKIMVPFFPILEFFAPNMVISATDLAKALMHLAKHGDEKQILENSDLKRISK
jgi:nucleoside-diphosphate-sugar epimerase